MLTGRRFRLATLVLMAAVTTGAALWFWLPLQQRWSFDRCLHPSIIGFTPDGRFLVVNIFAGQSPIVLINTSDGRVVRELLPGGVHFSATPVLAPNGKLLACSDGHELWLIEV